MADVFLSASVPTVGRGHYSDSSNPFLIQVAVRELVTALIRDHRLVWGGHPAITPMIWRICSDLGVEYAKAVTLYQSRFFEDAFPEENANFDNVIYIDSVDGDREASLLRMREAMLMSRDFAAGVFIGGMEGLEREYHLFVRRHPSARTILVPAPGGSARYLAERIDGAWRTRLDDVDFANLFASELTPALQTRSERRR